MVIDKNMRELIADLEYCIGSECYNPNSYNGYAGEEGASYRYPVYIPVQINEDEKHFAKARANVKNISNFEYADILQLQYRFGANNLFIGYGLVHVLEYLEKRYGLDLSTLEQNYQHDNKESK